jgi:hypothetical protein
MSKRQSQGATPNSQPGGKMTLALSLRLPNALPFSNKPAAESVPRFYTDVPAAGLSVLQRHVRERRRHPFRTS